MHKFFFFFKSKEKKILRNGPDRCCWTCRTCSEWWYWFCRRTGLPKTPTCILLKPIPEPSFSFRFLIYITVILLPLQNFSNFRLQNRGSHIVSPHWAELSFHIGKFECVVLRLKWLYMVSSLGCEFAIATTLSQFRTFLFGFYNFIWRTPLLAIVILIGFSWMRGLINAWI